MTSGQFHTVPIGSIRTNREKRQRRDVTGDIESLADSIRRLGLIHPIVITRDGDLVAGERRLTACNSLGHTHIAAQYTDELDPLVLHLIELEENIKRKNLDWQDECNAVLEYVETRRAETPGISLEEIASALGVSQEFISNHVGVAQELRRGNPLIATAPKFSTARGIMFRANERRASIEEFYEEPEAPTEVLNEDFMQWVAAYSGPKFNFIHCDFPYGIGADTFNQGAAPSHGGYDDDEKVYWDLCHCLIHNLDRLCTDDCHFMFWFSMRHYGATLELFDDAGIRFDRFPLVWVKSDNVGILPDPQRGPRRIYETAFFGSRGDRKIARATSNAVFLPSDRSVHMSIKPVPVLNHFFRMFVDESTQMLDPTCGSGSSLRAAEELGAGHVLGLEINREFADGARLALRTSRG